jgi:hypothetical protein
VQELSRGIRDGVEKPQALDVFYAETRLIPHQHVKQYEAAIRSASYDLGPAPNRLPWRHHSPSLQFVYPWFDLFSADGFRRERALTQLDSSPPSRFLFSVLLRRLNDWVPQVREAAREAIYRVLHTMPPAEVAEAMWLVLPVRKSWGRITQADDEVLNDAVDFPGVAVALSEKLLSESIGPAATVLRQASRRPTLDRFLPALADRAKQPAVRSLAYRMLFDGKAVWPEGWQWKWIDKSMGLRTKEPKLAERHISQEVDLDLTLQAAAMDRAAVVRRVAGDYLIAHRSDLDESRLKLAQMLAADRSRSVASRGRFVLEHR